MQREDAYLFPVDDLWRVAYERATVRTSPEGIMAVGPEWERLRKVKRMSRCHKPLGVFIIRITCAKRRHTLQPYFYSREDISLLQLCQNFGKPSDTRSASSTPSFRGPSLIGVWMNPFTFATRILFATFSLKTHPVFYPRCTHPA